MLVSDYQKGVITRRIALAAIDAARERRIQSLVDPKVPHIDYYAGATLITPNHHEAEAVTLMRIRTTEDARAVAARFRERASCESVLVTRGEHGMWLLGPDGEHDLPAEAREVSDVTGAGDTVIAAIALALAAGGPLEHAARLANRAAGLAVSRFGPAAITAAELSAALAAGPYPADWRGLRPIDRRSFSVWVRRTSSGRSIGRSRYRAAASLTDKPSMNASARRRAISAS